LRGIETQARAKLLEAVAEGQKVAGEIRAQAQKEAQDRLQRAEDEMMREREKAKELLKEQVIQLSLATAEKILKSKLDDAAQRRLPAQFIDEVGALRGSRTSRSPPATRARSSCSRRRWRRSRAGRCSRFSSSRSRSSRGWPRWWHRARASASSCSTRRSARR